MNKKNIVISCLILFLAHFKSSQARYISFQGSGSSIELTGTTKLNIGNVLTSNGIIRKNSTSSISADTNGSTITLTNGQLDQNFSTNISRYVVDTTNKFSMTGSETTKYTDGTVVDNLNISGASNIITGFPTFSGTVTLASGADVTVGIKSKMNVDVALGSGTFKLSDDLRFSDNKRFTGTGTVNLQNYKLKFGAKPLAFTSAITWFNASDIDLGGLTTLSTTWTFTGDAVINGNGNVLDMTSAGVLAINAGTTLSIADAYIKGFGSTGDITFANNTTSILRLSNVVIEMTGSKTISGGQVIIDGPTTIITKNNTLTFSSSGVLTINGQSLQYDRLGNVSGGITPTTAGANLVLNNGARIVEINAPADLTSINNKLATIDVGPGNISVTGSATMSYDWFISEDHAISVSATSTLSGNGHKIKFSDRSATQLTVANSVTLTTSDLVLEDLQPSQVSLGSGSGIIFGNNTTVRLGKNCTLNSTWRFSGTSTLDGQNKMLSLGSSGVIETQANSTLTLKDLTIYDVNGTNLRCLNNTGSIIFDNVKLINRNRWRFQNGAFSVLNNLSFLGGGIYSYESAYASTINDNSSLIFSDAITFSYDPAKGAQQAVAGQQNLVFTNTSSKLICDGITLKITNTGMRLTKGTIQFDKNNSIYSDANVNDKSHGLIFGLQDYVSDPQIIIGPDSKIIVETGVVEYENEDNTIPTGGAIVIKNNLYNTYLQNSPYELGGGHEHELIANTSKINDVKWYFTQLGGQSKGVFAGTNSYGIQGGYINLPTSYNYIYFSPAATVSTPYPPYNRAFALGQANQEYIIQGGGARTNLQYGDVISFPLRFSGNIIGYLGTSNLTYGGYKEIYVYINGSNTPPPNNSHLWTVERY